MPPDQGGEGNLVPLLDERAQQLPVRQPGPVGLDEVAEVLDDAVDRPGRHRLLSTERWPFTGYSRQGHGLLHYFVGVWCPATSRDTPGDDDVCLACADSFARKVLPAADQRRGRMPLEPELLMLSIWDQFGEGDARTTALNLARLLPSPWQFDAVEKHELGGQRRFVAFSRGGDGGGLAHGGAGYFAVWLLLATAHAGSLQGELRLRLRADDRPHWGRSQSLII